MRSAVVLGRIYRWRLHDTPGLQLVAPHLLNSSSEFLFINCIQNSRAKSLAIFAGQALNCAVRPSRARAWYLALLQKDTVIKELHRETKRFPEGLGPYLSKNPSSLVSAKKFILTGVTTTIGWSPVTHSKDPGGFSGWFALRSLLSVIRKNDLSASDPEQTSKIRRFYTSEARCNYVTQ